MMQLSRIFSSCRGERVFQSKKKKKRKENEKVGGHDAKIRFIREKEEKREEKINKTKTNYKTKQTNKRANGDVTYVCMSVGVWLCLNAATNKHALQAITILIKQESNAYLSGGHDASEDQRAKVLDGGVDEHLAERGAHRQPNRMHQEVAVPQREPNALHEVLAKCWAKGREKRELE